MSYIWRSYTTDTLKKYLLSIGHVFWFGVVHWDLSVNKTGKIVFLYGISSCCGGEILNE